MRAMLRLLVCLVISASIAIAAIPVLATVPQVVKAGCCAKVKLDAQANGCGHHSPKPDREKECCATCAFGLALFFTPATPFIHSPSGGESFAIASVREQVRSHRPPVPPPRA